MAIRRLNKGGQIEETPAYEEDPKGQLTTTEQTRESQAESERSSRRPKDPEEECPPEMTAAKVHPNGPTSQQ